MNTKKIVILLMTGFLLVGLAAETYAASTRRGERSRAQRQEQKQEKETPLALSTFAGSVTLDGEAGAVLSYSLPESVHKTMVRRDFSDLCVFDADGNPVPFQLRSPRGESTRLAIEKEVPFFVWQPGSANAGAPDSMDIEVNTKGGIVRIKGQTDGIPKPGPVSYILDMQPFLDANTRPTSSTGDVYGPENLLQQVIQANLAGDEGFMTYVSIKTSSDLASWTPVGSTQVLARMIQGDAVLERDTLAIARPVQRYVLLQFTDSDAPVVSFTAKAGYGKTSDRHFETIIPGSLSDDKRTVSYHLPGRFPLTAIGFDLPQAEMMAVRLMGADDPKQSFSRFASGFIYRLEKDGTVLTGEPFPVTQSRLYWNLQATGDIPFATAPGMRIYWKPQELLFLARGKGPWTVAFGRNAAVQASSLPMLAQGDVKPAREIAVASPEENAKTVPTEPADGDNGWILWAVLILAVVFLSGISLWLLKSMKR